MPTMTPEQIEAVMGPGWVKEAMSSRLIYTETFIRSLLDTDPWPHLVHYQKNRVIYIPPDEFLAWRPHGPSDCTWIVPGTGQASPPPKDQGESQ